MKAKFEIKYDETKTTKSRLILSFANCEGVVKVKVLN